MNKAIVIMLMLVMISCSTTKCPQEFITTTDKKAILVLDSWSMDLPAWERTNRNYDYEEDGDRIYVNMSRIPPAYLSEWLKENNKHVVFDESVAGILLHHKIDKPLEFKTETKIASLTYEKIVEILTKIRSPLRDSFKHYVKLFVKPNNELTLDSSTYFMIGNHYYPMAFFMAVGRENSFDPSTKFTFYKGKHTGTDSDSSTDTDVIIIEVDDRNGKNLYDFAQYPPLK